MPESVLAKVCTVEPTGDIIFVQIYLGDSIVIASLDPSIDVEPDEPVWIEFGQERMHLFDGATELALGGA